MADPEPQQFVFSQDALQQLNQGVAHAVSAEFDRRAEQARHEQMRQENARAAAHAQRSAPHQVDPVAATVAPVVKPWIDALQLRTALEVDNAKFYARNPDAQEFESQVEDIVNRSVAQGRPVDRDTAWKFYKGANQPYFFERQKEIDRFAAERAANAGMTLGPSGQARDLAPLVNLDHNTPLKDLEEALKGRQI